MNEGASELEWRSLRYSLSPLFIVMHFGLLALQDNRTLEHVRKKILRENGNDDEATFPNIFSSEWKILFP